MADTHTLIHTKCINTLYCLFERQIAAGQKPWDSAWSLLWLAFLHNNPGLMGGSEGNWESQGVWCRWEEDKEIGEWDEALLWS